ncbi:MAG: hypothetical protein KatS3mg109_0590 [Pirellulaceae bacterium]|nr:MAG: hypothetical protein KatS3mg109_0590 [Pirellulaceae bacterium]
MVEEQWVSVDRVVAHLGVTCDSIYRCIERNGLPAHRVGRLFRVKLSELYKWVIASAVGVVSQKKP